MLVHEIKMSHVDGGYDLIYYSAEKPDIDFKLGIIWIASAYGDAKSVELLYPFTVNLVNADDDIESTLKDRKLYGHREPMIGLR